MFQALFLCYTNLRYIWWL